VSFDNPHPHGRPGHLLIQNQEELYVLKVSGLVT